MGDTRRIGSMVWPALGPLLVLTLAAAGCGSDSASGGSATEADAMSRDTGPAEADAGQRCLSHWCGENERCVMDGWTPECLCDAPYRWYETVWLPDDPQIGLGANRLPIKVCRKPMPEERIRCISGPWAPEGWPEDYDDDLPPGAVLEPYMVVDDREWDRFCTGAFSVDLRDDGEGTRIIERSGRVSLIHHVRIVHWDPDNVDQGEMHIMTFDGTTGECSFHEVLYPYLPQYWLCSE